MSLIAANAPRERMFETPEDKARERAFAKQIAESWGLETREKPKFHKTDYLFYNWVTGKAFIGELKTAFSRYSQSEFPLALRKYRHILEIAYNEMCNAFLFVKFWDGRISWLPIASPDGSFLCWTTSTLVPLHDPRQRTGNIYDDEPGFRINRKFFKVD